MVLHRNQSNSVVLAQSILNFSVKKFITKFCTVLLFLFRFTTSSDLLISSSLVKFCRFPLKSLALIWVSPRISTAKVCALFYTILSKDRAPELHETTACYEAIPGTNLSCSDVNGGGTDKAYAGEAERRRNWKCFGLQKETSQKEIGTRQIWQMMGASLVFFCTRRRNCRLRRCWRMLDNQNCHRLKTSHWKDNSWYNR